jgi:hypothetical protein
MHNHFAARKLAFVFLAALLAPACGASGGGTGVVRRDGGGGDVPIACSRNADCADDVFCNGDERCESGFCAAGAEPACDDDVDCTRDACDAEMEACTHTARNADWRARYLTETNE